MIWITRSLDLHSDNIITTTTTTTTTKMALNGLICADVPLSNYSLTHYYYDIDIVWLGSGTEVR